MKLSIEITPKIATEKLELNGKIFSETWVPSLGGYKTTGPGIDSQLETEYGEDYCDTIPGLDNLLDTMDDLDITNIIDAFDELEEIDNT